jgi:amidase
MSDHKNLTSLTAREAVAALLNGEVSPLELVDAAAERIEEVEPDINALPTLCLERARDHARRIMAQPAPDDGPWLAGLPIAVKDLNDVAGVRTTYGSPIFAEHVPERSDYMVERLEARGAIVIAKSNTPEFGAGANTFNEVFGKTRNPWDTRLTCGGSSGGSAAALAAGEVWLATGSDLGGSLRIPASFCGVVGLRPSPGIVSTGPRDMPFDTLAVTGPMARNVADVALLLDAMAGAHAEDPISSHAPARPYLAAIDEELAIARVGFSADLGICPVMPEVARLCEAAAARFTELGAQVDGACPDFSEARDAFQTLRAYMFATGKQALLAAHRDQLKPEVIWNIEAGMKLSAGDVAGAENARTRLLGSMLRFFTTHDLLLCPTVMSPPFDVDIRYLEEVEGVKFDNYVDWLMHTFVLTLTGCPAISVPCGLTEEGLPVGLQIVGPPRGEHRVLSAAHAFDQLTGLAAKVPLEPVRRH